MYAHCLQKWQLLNRTRYKQNYIIEERGQRGLFVSLSTFIANLMLESMRVQCDLHLPTEQVAKHIGHIKRVERDLFVGQRWRLVIIIIRDRNKLIYVVLNIN